MRDVTNIYHTIDDEHTILTIQTSNYQIQTLINTCMVDTLRMFTWYKHSSQKYIVCHPSRKSVSILLNNTGILIETELILFHFLILSLDNIKPQDKTSVDHISRNTFDNRLINLRWASQADQNKNRGKVNRKQNAQELPDDIKHLDLPTFVTWNRDKHLLKDQTYSYRYYFRIEKHPALGLTENGRPKFWSSSKSSKINNIEKYNKTIEKLNELNGMVQDDEYVLIGRQNEKQFNEIVFHFKSENNISYETSTKQKNDEKISNIERTHNHYQIINEHYSSLELISKDGINIKSLIDTDIVPELKQFVWEAPHKQSKNSGYYICATVLKNHHELYKYFNIKQYKSISLHRFVLLFNRKQKHISEEKLSIDHINIHSLDNRIENLRWATYTEQAHNKNRLINKKVPSEIPQPLPLFMSYNEWDEKVFPSGNIIKRNAFYICNHPAFPYNENGKRKIWSSRKHHEVDSIDKYNEAIKKLNELNNILDVKDPIQDLREKNDYSYRQLLGLTCKEIYTPTIISKTIDFSRDNLSIKQIPDYEDFIVITHLNKQKLITNSKFFKELKNFGIYTEHNTFLADVTDKNKEHYKLNCKKASLARVILHLNKQFCNNEDKKKKYTCHRNGINNDYRIENLYWGSKTEQQFCKETKTITNYDRLPEEFKELIKINDIPKYVYYHTEEKKENKASKEYFFIKHHPYQENGMLTSTTSFKVSHIDKYNEILEKLKYLNSKIQVNNDTSEFVTKLLMK